MDGVDADTDPRAFLFGGIVGDMDAGAVSAAILGGGTVALYARAPLRLRCWSGARLAAPT